MATNSHPNIDITPHWASVQDDIVRIVDLIPDDRMNWSPKPELWNFRGILIHVADARDGWLTRAINDGEPYPNIWTTARSKDDIRRELARTWTRLGRFLANQSQLDASYPGEHNGQEADLSGHWIAFHLLEHDIHHRAELLQRLALLGVDHGIDF